MRAVVLAMCVLAACRSRSSAPVARAHDASPAIVAIDAGHASDPAWPPRPGAPSILVEEHEAIVVRSIAGARLRELVSGTFSRATYDPRVAVLWFLHEGRLEAIDLADATSAPTVIVDDMPDLSFQAGRGESVAHPMCDACVTVSAVPPAVGVTAEANASGGELQGDAWSRYERDRRIAVTAHPRLASTATAFLERIGRRAERVTPAIELGDRTWPLPRGARSQTPCADGCARAFSLEKLGWQLLVTGRGCDCLDDRCWGTCVLYEPTGKKYAQPSQPQTFGSTATSDPACHIMLDTTHTAYILDEQHVCSAAGCVTVRGRILGWVEPGAITGIVPEDMSACPAGG
jgi:hypothetical protein